MQARAKHAQDLLQARHHTNLQARDQTDKELRDSGRDENEDDVIAANNTNSREELDESRTSKAESASCQEDMLGEPSSGIDKEQDVVADKEMTTPVEIGECEVCLYNGRKKGEECWVAQWGTDSGMLSTAGQGTDAWMYVVGGATIYMGGGAGNEQVGD